MKKKLWIIMILLAMVLAACGNPTAPATATEQSVSPNEVVSEARLKPLHATNLSFQSSGVVSEILVKEGDNVKQGDVLARLSNAGPAEAQVVTAQNDYDTLLRNESGDRAKLWDKYMEAQAARAKAQKKWDDLDLDEIQDEIDARQATVEDRREDLKDRQEDFDKYKNLGEDNSSYKDAKTNLENAQSDLDQAIANLETETRKRDDVRAALDAALATEAEAKHQYEISLDGPNAEKLALVKANLKAAQDTLANYVIIAPFDGVVADLNINMGDQVIPQTRVVSITDTSQWIVETTDVTELEVVKISVGQKVKLVPDALPDLAMKGTVTAISDAYTQQGGDILYVVTVRVDNPDPRLRWGMTVEATFLQ